MSGVFQGTYSSVYDTLYSDKDYDAECDVTERIFREFGTGPVRQVLDLGCGTGSHALRLAQRGYEVCGVDRSPAMLAEAYDKARELGAQAPEFLEGDLCELNLGRRFDAALMMFAVLGYQHENEQLIASLHTVRRHLKVGGLFAFDVWYGPAVLSDPPKQKVKTIEAGASRIIRITEPVLNPGRHRCHVHFHLLQVEGNRVVSEVREEHVMRFFFPLELELAFAQCGLALETLRAFPDFGREPDERTWNVMGVARAQ